MKKEVALVPSSNTSSNRGSVRSIKLFKRLPTLRSPKEKDSYPIISDEVKKEYGPTFEEDFRILEQVLEPSFTKFDVKALQMQNRFRRQQVILITTGFLVTSLGAVQASFSELKWPGILEAILAGVLTIFAQYARNSKAQEKFMNTRLIAESLRAEYFLFLARMHPYRTDDVDERRRVLNQRVGAICRQRGN
jgi:hypothetical protein